MFCGLQQRVLAVLHLAGLQQRLPASAPPAIIARAATAAAHTIKLRIMLTSWNTQTRGLRITSCSHPLEIAVRDDGVQMLANRRHSEAVVQTLTVVTNLTHKITEGRRMSNDSGRKNRIPAIEKIAEFSRSLLHTARFAAAVPC